MLSSIQSRRGRLPERVAPGLHCPSAPPALWRDHEGLGLVLAVGPLVDGLALVAPSEGASWTFFSRRRPSRARHLRRRVHRRSALTRRPLWGGPAVDAKGTSYGWGQCGALRALVGGANIGQLWQNARPRGRSLQPQHSQ